MSNSGLLAAVLVRCLFVSDFSGVYWPSLARALPPKALRILTPRHVACHICLDCSEMVVEACIDVRQAPAVASNLGCKWTKSVFVSAEPKYFTPSQAALLARTTIGYP